MKTVGIIAEYNPFHNGHKYQIDKIKHITKADAVVIAMSGNFVQRGTPAWTDKYLRTQMALTCGADFVFELPACYATASAEGFATAGISLLENLGFVDYICFGSECGDIEVLQKTATLMNESNEKIEQSIASHVRSGLSYPNARELSLQPFLQSELEKYPDLLSNPNNILGIEYIKAHQRLHGQTTLLTLTRTGNGYHSTQVNSPLASATAIRQYSQNSFNDLLTLLSTTMPSEVINILEQNKKRYPLFTDDFSTLIYYHLLTQNANDKNILDMSSELSHRIQNSLGNFINIESFLNELKTRQYTHSRISRLLLHCLLHIEKDMVPYPDLIDKELPITPYARLLGFRRESSCLLRNIQNIPLITKLADGNEILQHFYQSEDGLRSKKNADIQAEHPNVGSSPSFSLKDSLFMTQYSKKLLAKDIQASRLYHMIQSQKFSTVPIDEFRQPVIIQ